MWKATGKHRTPPLPVFVCWRHFSTRSDGYQIARPAPVTVTGAPLDTGPAPIGPARASLAFVHWRFSALFLPRGPLHEDVPIAMDRLSDNRQSCKGALH